jgi:glycosyltransferase involved in cell wall biosynthesis
MLPDDSELVLLGDGPARSSVEQLIARRGFAGRVRLMGRVSDEDLHRWFRTARVVVSMSRHESFGLTILEALAAGTPVVASDIPAHRETAEAQPPGAVRLVSMDARPDEIADAIVKASRDGLPVGVRVASWEDVIRRLLGVYASVLAPTTQPVLH